MTKKFISVIGLVLVAGLMLPACANRGGTQHPGTANVIELKPSDVMFTKIASGKDCEQVILGMQFNMPSYMDAQQQALQGAGAEHLLNEITYEGLENAFFLPNPAASIIGGSPYLSIIYGNHCRYVEGHGIKRR
ncbi:MAG: hypothetical protein AAF430_08565 [Myxococcota bacterium]